jgi:hypothetical protein
VGPKINPTDAKKKNGALGFKSILWQYAEMYADFLKIS